MKHFFSIFSFALILGVVLLSCGKTSEVSDLEKTAALKNVTVTYDSCSYIIGIPSGALGHTFQELRKSADSAKYMDPANYSITVTANLKANNTKTDASDAKFESTALSIIMDTIKSTPIVATSGSFEVLKAQTRPIPVTGTINLKTHRRAGMYMIEQTIDGQNLETTLTPFLAYNIGSYKGYINIISFQQSIPTRASDEQIAFLKSLYDSKIFAEPKKLK